jgi:uncharacterized delta-60 repeat protein
MRPRNLAVAWCVIAAGLSLVATPAVGAPRLDARFGDAGVARVPFKFREFREFRGFGALRPVRQADGKVLVAAQLSDDREAEEVVLARFGRAGALDTTFGRRGRVRIDFPWQFSLLTVLAQHDGRIVVIGGVGGYSYWGNYRPIQLGIVRLLPDGSRDLSFGSNGFVAWNTPWRVADELMDVIPQLALPQPDGRLLVAAMVLERTRNPETSWQRVVLVRFQPDGSVDQSFGPGGFTQLDWDGAYLRNWARLPDGRLVAVVSRPEGMRAPTLQSMGWWLHSFAADAAPAGGFIAAGSVRLGLDVLYGLAELVPSRGALLMIGSVDVGQNGSPAPAVRRILPDSSLDPMFGRHCGEPLRRLRGASGRGGAPTPDGGVLVTAGKLLIHARPRRFDSFAITHDAAGCIAERPLRLRGVTVSPPLLQRGRSALLGATFTDNHGLAGGLALIKIRR